MSSFSEMLIYMEQEGSIPCRLKGYDVSANLELLAHIVHQFLLCNNDTKEWTKRSHENVKDCNAAVTLRLVVVACLLHLTFGLYGEYFLELLGRNSIRNQLPREFVDALNRRQKREFLNAAPVTNMLSDPLNTIVDLNIFSEAFKKMGNPLVFVSLSGGHTTPKWCTSEAISLDMMNQSKEEMWMTLFPNINKATQDHKKSVEPDVAISCCYLHELQKSSTLNEHKSRLNCDELRKMLKSLQSMNIEEDKRSFLARVPDIKESVAASITIFNYALFGCTYDEKPYREASVMLNELKQLYGALDMRGTELVSNIPRIGALLRHIESKVQRMGSMFDELFLERHENCGKLMSEICHRNKQERTSEGRGSGSSSSQENVGKQGSSSSQAGNKGKGSSKTKKKPKGKKRRK